MAAVVAVALAVAFAARSLAYSDLAGPQAEPVTGETTGSGQVTSSGMVSLLAGNPEEAATLSVVVSTDSVTITAPGASVSVGPAGSTVVSGGGTVTAGPASSAVSSAGGTVDVGPDGVRVSIPGVNISLPAGAGGVQVPAGPEQGR